MVEGVALQHTVGRQVHHILQAALLASTDMQSSQLYWFDIEQASFPLMVELVQLPAAVDMHSFADHIHQALLHDHGTRLPSALASQYRLITLSLACNNMTMRRKCMSMHVSTADICNYCMDTMCCYA